MLAKNKIPVSSIAEVDQRLIAEFKCNTRNKSSHQDAQSIRLSRIAL